MIDVPEIIQTQAEPAAIIQLTIPRDEIRRVIDPCLREILGVLDDQGIQPAGRWYTHHFRIEPEIFDFEICIPVSRPIQTRGRVQPGDWPAMRLARTNLHGPYSGLPGAWRELDAWITAEGFTPGRELWERYLSGMDDSRDPSKWRTELSRPFG